jgi:hypothetical protein
MTRITIVINSHLNDLQYLEPGSKEYFVKVRIIQTLLTRMNSSASISDKELQEISKVYDNY